MIGYFKDKFVDESEMVLPIRSKVIQYGLGTFEGIRAYLNEAKQQVYLFRALDHYNRLLDSCKIFKLKSKYTAQEMVDLTTELIRKNGFKANVYIRPLFYHSSVKMAPVFEADDTEFAMYCHEQGHYLNTGDGIKVCVSSWRRVADNAIPSRAKPTGLYLNSALAREEAYRNGYDEAIFLTAKGTVSEGTGEHLFIIRDGIVASPPSTEDNLEGITRRTVIQLFKEMNIPFEERQVSRSELYVSDEAFFVGTGAEVTPIRSIDGRELGDGQIGPVTKRVQDTYFKLVRGNHGHEEWLTPIY
ncbi:MAG: branched-chain amino acid transaminase [Calditrichaeota bacterium]|nr:branched-chain amino acid transaminase [Calditrichota bacterium]